MPNTGTAASELATSLLSGDIVDPTKVIVGVDDLQPVTPISRKLAFDQLLAWTQAQLTIPSGGIPEYNTMAALRLATTGTQTAPRVYLRGATAAYDGGGGTWRMLANDIVYGSTYDDGGWHVVDASGRVWGREADVIVPMHFGVILAASQSTAESQSNQYTVIQKFFDFWADPQANGRSGSRNQSLGWTKRTRDDQWQRPAFWPAGYARTDTAIELEGYQRTPANFYASPSPGQMAMQGAVYVTYANPINGFRVAFDSHFLRSDCHIIAVKGQTNVSGVDKCAWNQRSFTQNKTAGTSAGCCRWPERADTKGGMYRTWAATTAYYKEEELTCTLANGSRYLYRVTADHTSASTAPSHTSGTAINLLCLGMYVTPTVTGGGNFDVHDLGATEPDCGIRIRCIGHMNDVIFSCEAQNFCVQVKLHPDLSDARTNAMLYGRLFVGQGYGCKVQMLYVSAPDAGNAYGWSNGMEVNMTGFMPSPTGATNPCFDSDQSVYAILAILDRATGGTYASNGVVFNNVSIEGSARTSNCEIVHAAWLYGHEAIINIREDLPTYVAVRWGREQTMALRPRKCVLNAVRNGRIDDNGMANKWNPLGSPIEHAITHSVMDMTKMTVQGFSNSAANGVVFPAGFPVLWFGGVFKRGIPLADCTYYADTDTWDWNDVTELPCFMVEFGDEENNTGSNYACIDLEVFGSDPYGRFVFQIFDSAMARINPQIIPTTTTGGVTDPGPIAPWDGGNANASTVQITHNSDQRGKQKWGIAPWVKRVAIGCFFKSMSGATLKVTSNRPTRIRQYTEDYGVAYPPEIGIIDGGKILRLRDPGAEAGGQTHWALKLAPNSTQYDIKQYYAASGVWVSGAPYLPRMYVVFNVSGGVGDLYRCIAGAGFTSSGTAPANDGGGGRWVLVKSAVPYCLPSDWVKVANRYEGQSDVITGSGSITVDFDSLIFRNGKVVLTGTGNLTLSATKPGHYDLVIKSDSGTSRSITYVTTVNGTAQPSSTPNTIGVVAKFYFDGTNWFGL